MPHEPSHFERPKNWPMIILITVGVIILIVGGYLLVKFLISKSFVPGSAGDLNNDEVNKINNLFNSTNNSVCNSDRFNCEDFDVQTKAQTVFDYCLKEGFGDVHQLDNDGDGWVCEGLR